MSENVHQILNRQKGKGYKRDIRLSREKENQAKRSSDYNCKHKDIRDRKKTSKNYHTPAEIMRENKKELLE